MSGLELNQRLHAKPFRPLEICLIDGSRIPVMQAARVFVSESSAVVPTETVCDSLGHPLVKRWRTIDLAWVSDVTESATPSDGTE